MRQRLDSTTSWAEIAYTTMLGMMWLFILIPFLETNPSWNPIPRESTLGAVAVLLPISVFWADITTEFHQLIPADVE